METQPTAIKQTAELLDKHFGTEITTYTSENTDLHELVAKLSIVIREMLDTDFERLLQIFYRVDLSEKKVREAIFDHKYADAATRLAELIVERELQKVITRKMFKEANSQTI
jgi:hypothetical protein